jgi:hypothetical protein
MPGTTAIQIIAKTSRVPVAVSVTVYIDPRTEPGKVRIAGHAFGQSESVIVDHETARKIADALWSGADEAELASATAGG